MRILVTNDDGIRAPGLAALVAVASKYGTVKIAAPDYERSACGHGMTLRDPLRVRHVDWNGIEAVEVDGLPVDCVNVGLTLLWPDGCDLLLSGINNGPNLGFDTTYSGTVAAAMEGCINDIKSVAISMAIFASGAPFHYETGAQWLDEQWRVVEGLPAETGVYYNINVPAIAYPEIQGHRFAKTGKRIYHDRVIERSDPWGRPYYWQGGVVVMDADQPGTDVQACREGYVSITPLRVDWTDHAMLERLEALNRSAARDPG